MPRTAAANPKWMLESTESKRLQSEYPTLWTDPHKTCETCLKETKPDGKPTFRWWNEDRSEIVEWDCDCVQQWIMYRYMLSKGIGRAYQRLSWMDATDVPQAALDLTWAYIDKAPVFVSRGVNLLYSSRDMGTGKTMMIMMLAKTLLDRGIDAYTVQMNRVVSLHTAGWRSPEDEKHFERQIMNCRFLLIDDLGKERSDADTSVPFIARMFDRVIRHRVANAMPIAFSSNFTLDQIRQSYGEYVFDLLMESCRTVDVSGPSFRAKVMERTNFEMDNDLSRPVVLR